MIILMMMMMMMNRSGSDQARWHVANIKKCFCPKTVCKQDKGRILVLITHR